MLSYPSNSQLVHNTLKKQLMYAFVILTVSLLVNASIRIDYYFLAGIPERSVTETLQNVMILITLCHFYKMAKSKALQQASLLFFGFFMVLLIRESDYWLDYITHGFWFYPAILVTLTALMCFTRNVKHNVAQLAQLLSIPAMNKVLIGIVLLITFSRLFGTGSFWQQVLKLDDPYLVKNIIQEGLELLCYCLIMLGSFESQRFVKNHMVDED